MAEKLPVFEPDNTSASADWIKWGAWDLPPYRSPEFFAVIGGEDKLESFKQTTTYKSAIEHHLINDDEWVADWCTPEADTLSDA